LTASMRARSVVKRFTSSNGGLWFSTSWVAKPSDMAISLSSRWGRTLRVSPDGTASRVALAYTLMLNLRAFASAAQKIVERRIVPGNDARQSDAGASESLETELAAASGS